MKKIKATILSCVAMFLIFSCTVNKNTSKSPSLNDSAGVKKERDPNVIIERPQDDLMQLHLVEQYIEQRQFAEARKKLEMIKKYYTKPVTRAKADFLGIKLLITEGKHDQKLIMDKISKFEKEWDNKYPDLVMKLKELVRQ